MYVSDIHRFIDYFRTPYGAGRGGPEPFRNGTMHARGGPLGILLTSTGIDGNGDYSFDDLCGSVEYTVSMQLDNGSARFTSDGFSAEQIDVAVADSGDIGSNVMLADYPYADWMMGMQLAHQTAAALYGFTPKPAKVVVGFVPNLFPSGQAFTPCGQLSFFSVWSIIVDVAAPALLDGDIYLPDAANRAGELARSGIGTAAHEYGHYSMCQALVHYSGQSALIDFWLSLVVSHFDYDKTRPGPNTFESNAEYLSYLSMGYTDYFNNDSNLGGAECGGWAGPIGRACLEADASFPLPSPSAVEDYIGSRTSILYDWVARSVDPNAVSAPADHLALPVTAVVRAMASVGSTVTTENMAAWLAGRSEYGMPGDALCRVFNDHRWKCDSLPGYFDDAGGARRLRRRRHLHLADRMELGAHVGAGDAICPVERRARRLSRYPGRRRVHLSRGADLIAGDSQPAGGRGGGGAQPIGNGGPQRTDSALHAHQSGQRPSVGDRRRRHRAVLEAPMARPTIW